MFNKSAAVTAWPKNKGTMQEMLSQQMLPVQAMQWPLEKHLMTTQIVPEPSQDRQDRI
jgi:hypothetical protein